MKKAFTLIELMIVIVVIGIMAAFGAANFGKTLVKAKARDAINNLSIIHAANMMYRARSGHNCTADNKCTGITDINKMNGDNSLNIIAGSLTYGCANAGLSCKATGSGLTVTVTLNTPIVPGLNPACLPAGSCP